MAEFCEFIIDCEHKTAPVQSTGYPSIRTPNIGRGWLELDDVNRVSKTTYEEWTRRAKPKEGDLILAREAPIGNVAIIPKNLEVCLGQRTVLIRANREKVNPHFLLYLLLGNEIQGKFQALSGGATVAHLNMGEIRKLELPKIPDRIIQDKIVAILSAYDDLLENNLRRITILEEMAQSLYREWFVKFRFPGHQKVKMVNSPLGKIPEGWEVKRLGEVIELAYGKGLKEGERIPGDIPVFGSSGVIGYHNQSLVNGPGIIVGRKGNVGSVHWTDAAFFPIDTVFYVITELPLYYVYFNLQTQNFISGDAAVPGLNRNQAYSLPCVLPKPDLLRLFSQTVEPIFHLLNLLRRKNEVLRQTRDLLLPKLISGELDMSELDIETGENGNG